MGEEISLLPSPLNPVENSGGERVPAFQVTQGSLQATSCYFKLAVAFKPPLQCAFNYRLSNQDNCGVVSIHEAALRLAEQVHPLDITEIVEFIAEVQRLDESLSGSPRITRSLVVPL